MRALPLLALVAACAAPDYERSRAVLEENRRLRARRAELQRELRHAQFRTAMLAPRVDGLHPDAWRGPRVNAIRHDLVSLSMGAEDGVAVGQRYEVRRGGLHVGYARIDNVMERISVARLESGGPVQVGDVAELVDG